MTLCRLDIVDLRNIANATIEPHPKLNIITGDNGSGKTSLLESIYVISTGRSFRSSKVKSLVNDHRDKLVVFASVSKDGIVHSLGVQKDKSGESLIRIDGCSVKAASELARWLPVQIIGPDIYELISEGPTVRRQFLDWGLFHVEQFFYPAWARYQKALDQRNALLRQNIRADSLYEPWELELNQSAIQIDKMRLEQLNRIIQKLEENKKELLPDLSNKLTIEYDHGFDPERGLDAVLLEERNREFLPQTTQHGPHRGDFKIKLDKVPAREVLSRGQAKLLSHAFRIAQVEVLNEIKNTSVCLLIDDIGSELDRRAQAVFFNLLSKCDAQLFVTTLDSDFVKQMSSDSKLFHVEHGTILELSRATMECQ